MRTLNLKFIRFCPLLIRLLFYPIALQAADSLLTDFRIVNGTYLGNVTRNYYGNLAPDQLNVIWKCRLGSGKTRISSRAGTLVWSGCGWTGQPLVIRIEGRVYLVQGAYDHHLKMIDASNGTIVWQYKFDDVIKGTGSLWLHPNPQNRDEQFLVLQGSRRGVDNSHYSKLIPSFRGISLMTGQEQWRLNVRRTDSYSRDVDASPLVLKDRVYANLENATFIMLNPDPENTSLVDGIMQPQVLQEHLLYTRKDVQKHGGNLVAESSPGLLGDHIYIAAGSGHIYGYNVKTDSMDWDFYIGSDIDGSAVVTEDSCLLVTIEKQYIKGQGGLLKLDPSKPADYQAVQWFLPTRKSRIGSWLGGVIGSAATNEATRLFYHPRMAACVGVDGYLLVVQHDAIDSTRQKVRGPNQIHQYQQPKVLFRKQIGPSISTPLFVGDKLIVAGYHGIYLFKITRNLEFIQMAHFNGAAFESTPVVHYGRIYAGSRNGYLYCFGGAG